MSYKSSYNSYAAWGCGEYASRMMEHLKLLKDNLSIEFIQLIPDVDFFLDSDPAKQGKIFFEKKIILPSEYETQMCETIIISVKNPNVLENECKWLLEIGQRRIITINEFFQEIYNGLVENKLMIQKSQCIKDKGILTRLKLEELLGQKGNDCLNKDCVKNIIANVGVSAFISGLWYCYRENNSAIIERSINWEFTKTNNVKTVGLISSRLGIGGAEHVVAILSSILTEKGYRVVLLNEIDDENDYSYSEKAERVITKKNFSSRTFEYLNELEQIVQEKQIDLVCFHIPYDGVEYFYKVLFFKCLGLHVITECHTSVANLMRRWGEIVNQDKIYRMNDRLVTLSTNDEIFWKQRDVKAVFIPNPVNTSLRIPFIKRNNHKRVLWIGRISQKEKCVQDAVRIFSLLYEKNKDYSLNIIGTNFDVNEIENLNKLISKYNLNSKIHMLGWKNDLSVYYRDSDVFLMTSPGEGFPMVLLEAKAYSLPVVMYELPYLELAKDDLGIISVQQGNIFDAAKAIDKMNSDNRLYEKKNQQSWDSVQEYINYDIGNDWKKLIDSIN